jgi:hypothetical protein
MAEVQLADSVLDVDRSAAGDIDMGSDGAIDADIGIENGAGKDNADPMEEEVVAQRVSFVE